ncbi:MAG: tetratricopeptide repeat protein, partial [Cyanothece sp. SIO1E1]|nr:tetratricopeptide repeat protein [Cyanothece sp. SIO1E1]
SLPDGSKKWLLRIPDWDFNWQSDYRYQDPPILPGGSIIHMSYSFDNSSNNPRNPNNPPEDVRGGWRSEDEMAEAMIQVIPVNPEDLPKLREAQKNYDFKLAGGEARFHYYSGIYLEQQNELDRAIQSYLRTVQIDPTFESGYYKLGSIYERKGDIKQAEALYREALAYNPELVPAQLGLAKLLMMTSRIRQAGFILTDVYAAHPTHLQTNLYLARYHFSRGNETQAIALLEEGKTHFENAPEYHLEYGRLLSETGQPEEAVQKLRLALQVVPPNQNLDYGRTLQQIQAEAHYSLATHLLNDLKLKEADQHLDDCLNKNPNHLDALLKSAALAIKNQQADKALMRLRELVGRPADKTFSKEDILKNLPQPNGKVLLEQAYDLAGSSETTESAP